MGGEQGVSGVCCRVTTWHSFQGGARSTHQREETCRDGKNTPDNNPRQCTIHRGMGRGPRGVAAMIVLFMTLGNVRFDHPNLADTLAFCIKESRAQEVFLFGSGQNREIVPLISQAYTRQTGRDMPYTKFVQLDHIDDIHHCFSDIRVEYEKLVKEDPDVDIILNNNSATKSMTSAMMSLALLTHRTILFIDGTRNPDGAIVPGTERIVSQTLYPIYDEMMVERAIQYFNHNQFSYAIQEVSTVCLHPQKENYRQLFRAYDLWDRFEHSKAHDLLSPVTYPGRNKEQFINNQRFLQILLRSKNKTLRYLCVLVDLINNAQRRYDDGRYDDAVARLYRAFELIAQVLLLSKGLDDIENKISFTQLKPLVTNRDRLNSYQDYLEGGNVLVGCGKKYQILTDIGIMNAEQWHQKMLKLLSRRNESILAHGLTPVDRETAGLFLEKINTFVKNELKEAILSSDPDIDELFRISRFVQIET